MADTTFIHGTVVQPEWLNEVNDTVYGLANPSEGGEHVAFQRSGVTSAGLFDFKRLAELEGAWIEEFWVTGDTDWTAAFNRAIAAINSGQISLLKLSHTNYTISAALDPLTSSGWSIVGSGMQTTRILMAPTAGTTGTFFTVGTASLRPVVWYFGEFEVFHQNQTSLNGTGNAFELVNCAQGTIQNIKATNCNGIFTFGRTSYGTLCNNTHIIGTRCIAYGPAGGKSIDLQSFAGGKLTGCAFSASSTASASFRGMYVHPQATDTADAMKFVSCEWNYPGPDPLYNIEYDGTYNSLGNQQFVNCVFDQSVGGANIYAHIDATPSANAKLDLDFTNCISNASTGAIAILADNTGNKLFSLSWEGGQLSQVGSAGKCVRVIGGHRANVKINGVEFISRTASAPVSAISIGNNVSGVQITNCTATAGYSNSDLGTPAISFQYFVSFEGAATYCTIKDNDFVAGASDFIQWVSQPVVGLETLVFENNFGPNGTRLPFTKQSAAGSSVVAFTYDILEDKVVTVKAKVQGRQAGTALLTRAYYEPTVMVYRITAGAATIQSTVTPISIENAPGLDASWSLSGNTLQLVCTSTAGQANNWYYDIELHEV